MNAPPAVNPEGSRPSRYAIRVFGHLEQRWAAWFDGLTLTHEDEGITLLVGPLADQTALHGVFHKLRDLGLPIVSVQWIDTKD